MDILDIQNSIQEGEYINRCREGDKEGYGSLFGLDYEEDEVHEELSRFDVGEMQEAVIDEISENETDILNDELYYKANDPVAKFQFDYDRSTCLTAKYPEAETTEESNSKELSFAPGEGRYPSDILLDKTWDINAFPLLHPNGKYGLNEKREITVKLMDQSYFKQ